MEQEYGFQWNYRNEDNRNIYNLCNVQGGTASIVQNLRDLINLGKLDWRGPFGDNDMGRSGANRRASGPPAADSRRAARNNARGFATPAPVDAATQWPAVTPPPAPTHLPAAGKGAQGKADSQWQNMQWNASWKGAQGKAAVSQWNAKGNKGGGKGDQWGSWVQQWQYVTTPAERWEWVRDRAGNWLEIDVLVVPW